MYIGTSTVAVELCCICQPVGVTGRLVLTGSSWTLRRKRCWFINRIGRPVCLLTDRIVKSVYLLTGLADQCVYLLTGLLNQCIYWQDWQTSVSACWQDWETSVCLLTRLSGYVCCFNWKPAKSCIHRRFNKTVSTCHLLFMTADVMK